MKMLITGSEGFIGKNLIEFYSKDYEIIRYTRIDDINSAVYKSPDIIINCAADIYQDSNMFESNVVLVNNLISCVKKTGCKFIQIGSSAEYGRKLKPSKETDFLDPTTFYEATKGASSLLCIGAAREYGLPIVVARPYSVYGNYEKEHRLFTRLYNAYTFNSPMVLNQGYHDFIYIKDFIAGINTLLLSDEISGDVVNFGSGIQTSNFDLLNKFKSVYDYIPKNITLNDKMIKSFESDNWICDITYAKRKYNFECKIGLIDGIIDMIKERKIQ